MLCFNHVSNMNLLKMAVYLYYLFRTKQFLTIKINTIKYQKKDKINKVLKTAKYVN